MKKHWWYYFRNIFRYSILIKLISIFFKCSYNFQNILVQVLLKLLTSTQVTNNYNVIRQQLHFKMTPTNRIWPLYFLCLTFCWWRNINAHVTHQEGWPIIPNYDSTCEGFLHKLSSIVSDRKFQDIEVMRSWLGL
jgi:hypothetical protein